VHSVYSGSPEEGKPRRIVSTKRRRNERASALSTAIISGMTDWRLHLLSSCNNNSRLFFVFLLFSPTSQIIAHLSI